MRFTVILIKGSFTKEARISQCQDVHTLSNWLLFSLNCYDNSKLEDALKTSRELKSKSVVLLLTNSGCTIDLVMLAHSSVLFVCINTYQ